MIKKNIEQILKNEFYSVVSCIYEDAVKIYEEQGLEGLYNSDSNWGDLEEEENEEEASIVTERLDTKEECNQEEIIKVAMLIWGWSEEQFEEEFLERFDMQENELAKRYFDMCVDYTSQNRKAYSTTLIEYLDN